MDRTKTAFIITKLELGGAQKSVLYTAANLDKNIFEPFLLCGTGGYFDAYAEETVKNIYFIPSLQRAVRPFKDWAALRQIRAALADIQPHIIHTNSSKAGILGRAAAGLFRKQKGLKKPKIVHTVHGFGFNDRQNFLARNFYIFLERLLAKYTDILIFVSMADLQTALKLKIAPPHKCRIIRAGAELKTKEDFKNFDKTAKLKELGLAPGSKIILSTANLKPQKNPLDMVRAAQAVCARHPEAVFLYLGTGELQKETENLVNNFGLQNNFKLLGHRDDTPELLAIADVFALSSLWEGLPMALAEALSMRIPAVCYDAGGISELLHDKQNGYLITRGDYEALAGGIMNALEGVLEFNPEAADLKEFDIKQMLKQQQDLYLELTREEQTDFIS